MNIGVAFVIGFLHQLAQSQARRSSRGHRDPTGSRWASWWRKRRGSRSGDRWRHWRPSSSRSGRGHSRGSDRIGHRHRHLRGSDSHTRRKGPTQNGVGGAFGVDRPGSHPLGS
jgi:hypothetical protein